MKISFRPVTMDDLDFLWRLHVEALKEHIEKTWGWDDVRQRNFVANIPEAGGGSVIVIDGEDAGFWHVIEYDSEILLNSIRLLSKFQNRGVGTRLITDLLNNTDKTVRLQVLKVNPARSLYERLGFQLLDETETHYRMINRAPRISTPATGHIDTRY